MIAHDLSSLLTTLPTLTISATTTAEEAMAAPRLLGRFNQCDMGLIRYSGQTPWERHPEDEMLHVLDGEVEFTLLPDDGRQHITLRAGSFLVVPGGVWHRSLARNPVTMIFGTPAAGGEHSLAEDPRS